MKHPKYANIIVDITHEKLDRSFQYKVPEELSEVIGVGDLVRIPFGKSNRLIQGYIIGLTNQLEFDVEKLKFIDQVEKDGVPIESQLIQLASWLREEYGSTMNQALKTVIPVKQTIKQKEKKYLKRTISWEAMELLYKKYENSKRYKARLRLVEAFLDQEIIPFEMIREKLHVSTATIKSFVDGGQMEVITESIYRNPIKLKSEKEVPLKLLDQQQKVVDAILSAYKLGKRETSLIHGITGSGKTEVYMEIIEYMISIKKQVIVLIPEIALTYQTVMRFYKRFGDRVSIVNSKLSSGERYDQFLRAKRGELDIMIGPRSALFTPFEYLGCIIIDEEHETSYKSETSPRYHARETAVKRAELNDGIVILGSATPSVDAYYKAEKDEYKLYHLTKRAKTGSVLPNVHIVDLREELKAGNKSIFSQQLKGLMEDRLEKKQQIMLFLNRRGYAGFISCRSCGEAMKCPHCDVSLTSHRNGMLVCHYCGHTLPIPKECPTCSSPYMAAFGIGTQKVESMVQKEFPNARVLRMDFDTTKQKGGHEKILSAFADGEVDILIGTQMIVKGHDFPKVTLVGVLAADLSLYSGDFHSGERTFQLLTQAVGRAGRSHLSGDAVIQTYQPEHYSIVNSAAQDYENFYKQEILYRSFLGYPPVCEMLSILVTSKSEDKASRGIEWIEHSIYKLNKEGDFQVIGPTDASVSKINDVFRKIIHVKCQNHGILINVKNVIENLVEVPKGILGYPEKADNNKGTSMVFKDTVVQFDFN